MCLARDDAVRGRMLGRRRRCHVVAIPRTYALRLFHAMHIGITLVWAAGPLEQALSTYRALRGADWQFPAPRIWKTCQ